jgi:hypothetical protein
MHVLHLSNMVPTARLHGSSPVKGINPTHSLLSLTCKCVLSMTAVHVL